MVLGGGPRITLMTRIVSFCNRLFRRGQEIRAEHCRLSLRQTTPPFRGANGDYP